MSQVGRSAVVESPLLLTHLDQFHQRSALRGGAVLARGRRDRLLAQRPAQPVLPQESALEAGLEVGDRGLRPGAARVRLEKAMDLSRVDVQEPPPARARHAWTVRSTSRGRPRTSSSASRRRGRRDSEGGGTTCGRCRR
ncbi:hypothetical protein [Nocardioides convexus]|uniref:hypothetical protein n=1 Tax=Nocardioides convexus TaxID=2712224 RepID=UPI0024187C3A|nr:hypothetical protein [Nocardioides convexus]